MPELGTSGSVRGASRKGRPYRDNSAPLSGWMTSTLKGSRRMTSSTKLIADF